MNQKEKGFMAQLVKHCHGKTAWIQNEAQVKLTHVILKFIL